MKALVTAFALLAFVAASTVPVVANAQTQTHHVHKKVSKKKHHVKKVAKKGSKKVKKIG
jgi:hypothetical protein